MKETTFLHPLARFELTEAEREKAAREGAVRSTYIVPNGDDGDGDDPALDCLYDDDTDSNDAARDAEADEDVDTPVDAPPMPPPAGQEAPSQHAAR